MRSTHAIVAFAIVALALLPLDATAQISSACDIVKLVARIATWFGILVFSIAVIVILYAGLLFMTGGGNEEQISKAKLVLLWALVGIAVALLATNAVKFVQNTVGGGLPTSCP